MNIKFEAGAVGAGATSRYGSGCDSTKLMRLRLQRRNTVLVLSFPLLSFKDNKAKMLQAFSMTTFSSSLFVRQWGRAKECKESL
jgi:hypothetical protein